VIDEKENRLEIAQWTFWWTSLLGPIYFALIVGLYLGRQFLSDVRIFFEITETITMMAAATLAAAAAGLIVVLV
jgi:hypothetical protein